MGSDTHINTSAGATNLKFERRVFIYALILPVLLAFSREMTGETALITNTPALIKLFAWAVGLLLGGLLAYTFWRIASDRGFVGEFSGAKTIFLCAAIIPGAIVTSSYLARWAFESAAFTGLEHKVESSRIKLMGVQGGKSGTFALLKAFPHGREFKAVISEGLYVRLAAIRPPLWKLRYGENPFCMTLPIEHGRWGTIRAFIPARLADGLNTYGECELSRDIDALKDESPVWSDALKDTSAWPPVNAH